MDAEDQIWKEARELTERPNVTLMEKMEIMRCIDFIQYDLAFIAPELRNAEGIRRWNRFLAARKGNLDHLFCDAAKLREMTQLIDKIHDMCLNQKK